MSQRFVQPAIRPDWLALHDEPVIDPGLPIIDAHHHMFDRPGNRYLGADYVGDIATGHRVVATVLVQARGFYRTAGAELLLPVGETDYAVQTALENGHGLCSAIVGHADLTLGNAVRPLLDAHIAAGQGRFRGIRHILAWDADARLLNPAYPTTEDMMAQPAFLAGFAELAKLRLSFDAWLHFHQIPRLVGLARRFPEVPIVLNHCGGVLGIGAYAEQRDTVYREWRRTLSELAKCPNVSVKIGGLGMALSGFGFDAGDRPPSSVDLAKAWQPWVHSCIDLFGPDRAMFESNFPVDKASYSYLVGWNAFKRLIAGAGPAEVAALMSETAARFYRIKLDEARSPAKHM